MCEAEISGEDSGEIEFFSINFLVRVQHLNQFTTSLVASISLWGQKTGIIIIS